MHCLVIRGATGVAIFNQVQFTRSDGVWRCSRDTFDAPRPSVPGDVVAFLTAVAAHAQTHCGAISQVVELDL